MATRRGGLLGVFAAAILNLVLQPCAFAMAADRDCPHCPPREESAAGMHHGHEADRAPCDTLEKSCSPFDEVSLDGRGGPAKSDGADQPVFAALPYLPDADLRPAGAAPGLPAPRPLAGAPPALNVLYCVYLK